MLLCWISCKGRSRLAVNCVKCTVKPVDYLLQCRPWFVRLQAALASLIAFTVGGVLPLLAAVFIRDSRIRLYVVLVSKHLPLKSWPYTASEQLA